VSVAAYIAGILVVPLSLNLIYFTGAMLRRSPAAALTPGHHRTVAIRSSLGNVVAERLSARFCSDESFRSSVLDAIYVMSSDREELPDDRSSLQCRLACGHCREMGTL
jgi:hypothetical protein